MFAQVSRLIFSILPYKALDTVVRYTYVTNALLIRLFVELPGCVASRVYIMIMHVRSSSLKGVHPETRYVQGAHEVEIHVL